MKLIIEIRTGNKAFGDSAEDESEEVCRILSKLVATFLQHRRIVAEELLDKNNKLVGSVYESG